MAAQCTCISEPGVDGNLFFFSVHKMRMKQNSRNGLTYIAKDCINAHMASMTKMMFIMALVPGLTIIAHAELVIQNSR